MKKLMVVFVFAIAVSSVYAQNIRVGAVGGINLSFASAKEAGVVFHGSPGLRYALGGYADISIGQQKDFSFHPSILFSREAYAPDIYSGKTPVRISYLAIPLPVLYHSGLMDKKLFFGFGPYVAIAISGKYIDQGQTIKIVFGSDPNKDDGKRLDFGLDGNVGYQFNEELFFQLRFDLGLRQLYNETDTKVHTRNFGLTCHYLLWNNK
jgi:hypothetical protein